MDLREKQPLVEKLTLHPRLSYLTAGAGALMLAAWRDVLESAPAAPPEMWHLHVNAAAGAGAGVMLLVIAGLARKFAAGEWMPLAVAVGAMLLVATIHSAHLLVLAVMACVGASVLLMLYAKIRDETGSSS